MLFSQMVDYRWNTRNGSCYEVVWQFTADRCGLTEHFIFSITVIAIRCDYTESSVVKISTLDYSGFRVVACFHNFHYHPHE